MYMLHIYPYSIFAARVASSRSIERFRSLANLDEGKGILEADLQIAGI
jgi:hypothetical protein